MSFFDCLLIFFWQILKKPNLKPTIQLRPLIELLIEYISHRKPFRPLSIFKSITQTGSGSRPAQIKGIVCGCMYVYVCVCIMHTNIWSIWEPLRLLNKISFSISICISDMSPPVTSFIFHNVFIVLACCRVIFTQISDAWLHSCEVGYIIWIYRDKYSSQLDIYYIGYILYPTLSTHIQYTHVKLYILYYIANFNCIISHFI